jgi:hypothetical protein
VPPPEAAGASARAAEARALRGERIPQLVGMSAAARILAGELPSIIAGDAKQVPHAKALAEQLGVDEETAGRIRALVVAAHLVLARRMSSLCAERADEWLAAAHRADGRAEALAEHAAALPESHAQEG